LNFSRSLLVSKDLSSFRSPYERSVCRFFSASICRLPTDASHLCHLCGHADAQRPLLEQEDTHLDYRLQSAKDSNVAHGSSKEYMSMAGSKARDGN
jgi:hypothetical protein